MRAYKPNVNNLRSVIDFHYQAIFVSSDNEILNKSILQQLLQNGGLRKQGIGVVIAVEDLNPTLLQAVAKYRSEEF
jgi:ABC-type cobalamin transport system ATPase subunit